LYCCAPGTSTLFVVPPDELRAHPSTPNPRPQTPRNDRACAVPTRLSHRSARRAIAAGLRLDKNRPRRRRARPVRIAFPACRVFRPHDAFTERHRDGDPGSMRHCSRVHVRRECQVVVPMWPRF
jgi:hypothetical protein